MRSVNLQIISELQNFLTTAQNEKKSIVKNLQILPVLVNYLLLELYS